MKNIIYALVAMTLIVSACNTKPSTLPIYGERTPVQKNVNGKVVVDTIYKTIPNFSFLNQDSVMINQDMFNGKIYVADFFFTSCPSICPPMHRNLMEVYREFKNDDQVMFLSHSIDFKYDVPHVLKAYAKKLGAYGSKWQFIHGDKEAVYSLAQNNYLVSVNVDPQAPGGYVHQGFLILVDKQKRVRGAYDGTQKEQVQKLMEDINTLLKEQSD
jgi:protein SCO1/2